MAYTSEVTLVASSVVTATVTAATGTAVASDLFKRGTAILTVSLASGSFTLDCAIQTIINGVWTDIARFAQVTGNGSRVLWDIGDGQIANTNIEEVIQALAITVSTKRAGPWGTQIRAIWTVGGAPTTFTWSLNIAMQA